MNEQTDGVAAGHPHAMNEAPARCGSVDAVVQQHADEAAFLAWQRSALTSAAHVGLRHLLRHDERLAAHLDGLIVAGKHGWRTCERLLGDGEPGAIFVATVLAAQAKAVDRLERLLAQAEVPDDPTIRKSLLAGLGWVPPHCLVGVGAALLGSRSAFRRAIGIRTCCLQQVDPGDALSEALNDPDAVVRAAALRSAAELGRVDLAYACSAHANDCSMACRFWAGYAAMLLGQGSQGRAILRSFALADGPFRVRALQLYAAAAEPEAVRELLAMLAGRPSDHAALMLGVGSSGDPAYLPWLLDQMKQPTVAPWAGEAWTWITGCDLALQDLDVPLSEPKSPSTVPEDADADVEQAQAELPCPDPARLAAWWSMHSDRFQPGTRYFLGQPLSEAQMIEALKTASSQRQRLGAAYRWCLLSPGTALFNCAAPAWLQQRRLSSV